MKTDVPELIFLTADELIRDHWSRAAPKGKKPRWCRSFEALTALASVGDAVVLIDGGTYGLPPLADVRWAGLMDRAKLVYTSMRPMLDQGVQVLDAGCVGYCHSLASQSTLEQVLAVVRDGQVWIGRDLMNHMLRGMGRIGRALAPKAGVWQQTLTPREQDVAKAAADGASNRDIALALRISERTVKAHLTSVFEKLAVRDRLELALKVHGIR